MIDWVTITDKAGQPTGRQRASILGADGKVYTVGWINKIKESLIPGMSVYGYHTSTGRLFTDPNKARQEVEAAALGKIIKEQ